MKNELTPLAADYSRVKLVYGYVELTNVPVVIHAILPRQPDIYCPTATALNAKL